MHLFCKAKRIASEGYEVKTPTSIKIAGAINSFLASKNTDLKKQNQLMTIGILGHKADIAFMALSESAVELRRFQEGIAASGLKIVDSYLSLTEISEYAEGVPQEMKEMRLYPQLSTIRRQVAASEKEIQEMRRRGGRKNEEEDGVEIWREKPVWSFYPMSKRRGEVNNWFTLPFEKRKELMYEHGTSGRNFKGRILQVITGSTGIDDYEWGVTLFCESPDALKEVVYKLRFDEASAKYAEFGPFYTGYVDDPETLIYNL